MTFTIPGLPIGKPRMTRRDKWKQRPCVLRYRSWADGARAAINRTTKLQLTKAVAVSICAYFEIPKSKRGKVIPERPHTYKPDADNILKAVCDALFENDEWVTKADVEKVWAGASGPRVVVRIQDAA